MKKKNKIIIIICLVVIVLTVGGYFGLNYYLDQDIKKIEEEQDQNYGYVEKETVETSVAKFNTQIMDKTKWATLPVNDENLIIHENMYWYSLYEDIALVVIAEDFTNDKSKDITQQMFIYIPVSSEHQDKALEYIKYLIKSNNTELTAKEVDNLLEGALKYKDEKRTANNGKGIDVGIFENEDHIEYQVTRLYK